MLQSLLPELGTDIKGQMQPAERLLDCSGYADRPDDFANLLRILHTDLRLITLTELGGAVDDAASAFTPSSVLRSPSSILRPPSLDIRGYQLTHDYLVPSLCAIGSTPRTKGDATWAGRADVGGAGGAVEC